MPTSYTTIVFVISSLLYSFRRVLLIINQVGSPYSQYTRSLEILLSNYYTFRGGIKWVSLDNAQQNVIIFENLFIAPGALVALLRLLVIYR